MAVAAGAEIIEREENLLGENSRLNCSPGSPVLARTLCWARSETGSERTDRVTEVQGHGETVGRLLIREVYRSSAPKLDPREVSVASPCPL